MIGLTSITQLKKNHGMLFVFGKEKKYNITCNGMSFPIDIIFIDKNLKIVDFYENADQSWNPFKSFVPKKECKYILEMGSGFIEKNKLTINDKLIFDKNIENI